MTHNKALGITVMTQLFIFLLYNKAATRIGRATWAYFAVVASGIALARFGVPESMAMLIVLVAPVLLLLNRLDTSGPTREAFERTQEQLRKDREAAEWANRRKTLSWRLGRWVGQLRGRARR